MTRADKTTPAAQASVVLSQGGIDKGKATTDEKGKYKIEGIAFGDYDIVASLAEASPSDIKKVKVAAGPPQAVGLQLKSILLIVALALALFPGASRAQRLYNKERDQRAQTALPLPRPLRPGKTSGDLNSLCLIAYRLTTPSVLQPRLNV